MIALLPSSSPIGPCPPWSSLDKPANNAGARLRASPSASQRAERHLKTDQLPGMWRRARRLSVDTAVCVRQGLGPHQPDHVLGGRAGETEPDGTKPRNPRDEAPHAGCRRARRARAGDRPGGRLRRSQRRTDPPRRHDRGTRIRRSAPPTSSSATVAAPTWARLHIAPYRRCDRHERLRRGHASDRDPGPDRRRGPGREPSPTAPGMRWQANGEMDENTCAPPTSRSSDLNPAGRLARRPDRPGARRPDRRGRLRRMARRHGALVPESVARLGIPGRSRAQKQGTVIQSEVGGGWSRTVLTVTPGIPGDSGSGFMNGLARRSGRSRRSRSRAAGNGVGDLFERARLRAGQRLRRPPARPRHSPVQGDLIQAILSD